MKESIRYLDNAKEILRSVKIAGTVYADKKPVREAFGTAYLAILEAINEYLMTKKGYTEKELPKSIEGYRDVLKKHISVHNGKLMSECNELYDALHIAGYYRGLIRNVDAVKDYMKASKHFINRLN